ncbi:MAG: alpha/beta hydrolase fold domain-containing protein [Chloroflexi bacterium]|nr:alpha/beta hydrolase fold domain-containing protein [Chloroflexota bacterium]MXX49609.1 alpha/beta hydrolase fold domain-containing protein [Chloroflexota bacterium]MYA92421.1 alpha/beta hydrolase fold domain-containing protein [Chloroflexota bacterium]MYD39835.1 alpha/beta hydrolase fold domain-containing protein [Chloroflexota bacterium]MYE80158.1 alpha/beta hydrolase fold domain-containing protein [Chloroflexota bacterium]
MSFVDRLDPELAPMLEVFPAELLKACGDDPPVAREMLAQLMEVMLAALPPSEVQIEERAIPGPDGDIPIAIYHPPPASTPRPGLFLMHGGGYVVGTEREDMNGIAFADHVGCTVVSVGYRLAPEFTYQAAIADCFAAFNWMVDNADELGIDTSRIAIGGASAGGGMTAGFALYNRDNQGPGIALQLIIYPMLDDTHETPSGYEVTHPNVWNRDVSLKAWKMYLGDEYGTDRVSPYAAAARATDLSGLPPAFVTVGAQDLFRDEAIDYAQRLMAAGVPTELEVYPGMFHGAENMVPTAAVSQRMRLGYLDALKRAIG